MANKKGYCCKLGASKYSEIVNSFRDQHYSLSKIYGWCQLMGVEVSKETIIKHFREHYKSDENRPAYVPTCKVCVSPFNDEFKERYFRGDPVDGLTNWLVHLGMTISEAYVLTHIQHQALDKSAKVERTLLLEPVAEPEIEELIDASVENLNPLNSDALDIKGELKRLILLKKSRVQRRVQLDAHTPTPDTRREMESLEKTLIEYNKLTDINKDDTKSKRATLVTLITKEMNIMFNSLDDTTKEKLAVALKNELVLYPDTIRKSILEPGRTGIIIPVAQPRAGRPNMVTELDDLDEVIINE